MQIILPNRAVIEAPGYVVTCSGDDLPPLNRLPDAVAQRARALTKRLSRKPADTRACRGDTADGQAVVVYRLKPGEELTRDRLESWSHRVALLARELESDVCVVLPPQSSNASRPRRVLTSLSTADYRFEEFRTKTGTDRKADPERAALVVPPARQTSSYRGARAAATAVSEGIAWARDLANTPPNVATPAWMARQASEYFRSVGARVEVLGPKGIAQRKMGGLAAVGSGSANGPRCVRVRLGKRGRKVALVGKGVTFDTGGISIKPAALMDEMKYDKSGACAVLGIGRAVAALELELQLELYVPLAENMLGGRAYRPGDIVRCMNGKTVEILNTDAEGRMILADALHWAANGEPDHILDFATLTGACVVALGDKSAGLFSNDDLLAEALLRAADDAGEYLWRLPLWEHFSRQMQGNHGDLKNTGPRWGGASTAAAFLQEFIGEAKSWAHVDLAGPAYRTLPGKKRKESTGYGVALTVDWLRSIE